MSKRKKDDGILSQDEIDHLLTSLSTGGVDSCPITEYERTAKEIKEETDEIIEDLFSTKSKKLQKRRVEYKIKDLFQNINAYADKIKSLKKELHEKNKFIKELKVMAEINNKSLMLLFKER